jgi:hypothetical protein
MAQKSFFCQTAQYVVKTYHNTASAGLSDSYYLWDPGITLRIRFINGSTSLQSQVSQIGKAWEKYANIKFDFIEKGESHIRISFNDSGLIKPALGSLANIYPQDEPNCFIDTSLFKSSKTFRAMVLHVFGHIMGLQHENEVPLKGRLWNSTALQQYAKEKNWEDNDLRHHLIDPYSASMSNCIAADSKSVMYYNPKQNWTTEKYIRISDSLSKQDKIIISHLYPFKRDTDAVTQLFTVDKMDRIRVEKNKYGLSFYPEFDITIKNAHRLHMGIFFLTDEGKNIDNYDGKYSFDDFLATVKSPYLIPNGTYHLNYLKNDIGFYLPYSELPMAIRGNKVKIVFKVFFTDQYNMENQKEFASKPIDITLP